MAELRRQFAASAEGKLREMRALLDALERDPHDAASLAALERQFHRLAGMGGTYGYPRVSELGDEGERSMSGGAASAELVAEWRRLTEAIAREFQ